VDAEIWVGRSSKYVLFIHLGLVLAGKRKKKFAMSRRRRNSIIVICVLLAGVVIWLDRHHGRYLRQGIIRLGLPVDDRIKYHGKSFKVINIVDGDTVDIDIGDGDYDHTRIRLLGVDTPEVGNPKYQAMYFAPEATEFVTELALDKEVTVIIDTISDVRGRYGRLLAYLKLADGRVVNEELVRKGFGYADLRFAHSDYDKYVAGQDEAIAAKIGLWKEVTKDQLPGWLQRERPGILGKK